MKREQIDAIYKEVSGLSCKSHCECGKRVPMLLDAIRQLLINNYESASNKVTLMNTIIAVHNSIEHANECDRCSEGKECAEGERRSSEVMELIDTAIRQMHAEAEAFYGKEKMKEALSGRR